MIGKPKLYRGLWSDVTALQRHLCKKNIINRYKAETDHKNWVIFASMCGRKTLGIEFCFVVWHSILFSLSNALSYSAVNPVVGVIESAAHNLVYLWDTGQRKYIILVFELDVWIDESLSWLLHEGRSLLAKPHCNSRTCSKQNCDPPRFIIVSSRCVETQVINIGPTPLPFSFPFFFLSLFFLSLLSVSVFPFLFPFSLVLSFRLVVFPFVSCIALFAFLFASLLSLVADSVILLFRLGATPPLRSLRSWSIPLACCLLSRVLDVDLFYFFFSSFPFFDFDLDIVCFILSFSCGYYAVSSVSVSAATRLAYDNICILIRTYADLTFFFLSEFYDLFQLFCVLSCVFICFPPKVIFRSRVIGACPVTTDCIVAMS